MSKARKTIFALQVTEPDISIWEAKTELYLIDKVDLSDEMLGVFDNRN